MGEVWGGQRAEEYPREDISGWARRGHHMYVWCLSTIFFLFTSMTFSFSQKIVAGTKHTRDSLARESVQGANGEAELRKWLNQVVKWGRRKERKQCSLSSPGHTLPGSKDSHNTFTVLLAFLPKAWFTFCYKASFSLKHWFEMSMCYSLHHLCEEA